MVSLLRHIAVPVFVKMEEGVLDDFLPILHRHCLLFASFGIVSGSGPTLSYADRLKAIIGESHAVRHIKVSDNRPEDVDRVFAWMIHANMQVIIAVGGGRVLDVAKAACARRHQTLILVPTIVSSDSIASPIAVIRRDNIASSIPGQPPLGVLIDLDIVRHAPERFIRAGVGDLLSNLSAAHDWRLARQHGESHDASTEAMARIPAERILHAAYLRQMRNGEKTGFLRALTEGLVLSGIAMGMNGDSRPCSGSEHMISHAMDALKPGGFGLHGEQVLLATYFTLHLQGQDALLAQVRRHAEAMDMVRHPGDLGMTKDTFLQAVRRASDTRPGRYSILNLEASPATLDRAYEQTFSPGSS